MEQKQPAHHVHAAPRSAARAVHPENTPVMALAAALLLLAVALLLYANTSVAYSQTKRAKTAVHPAKTVAIQGERVDVELSPELQARRSFHKISRHLADMNNMVKTQEKVALPAVRVHEPVPVAAVPVHGEDGLEEGTELSRKVVRTLVKDEVEGFFMKVQLASEVGNYLIRQAQKERK